MVPGTKFEVVESKCQAYLKGTTGFVAYAQGTDIDFPSVMVYRTVVTRRGRTGSRRLERTDLASPVGFLTGDSTNCDIAPPPEMSRFCRIELLEGMNLETCPKIDFAGWAAARALFYSKLKSRRKAGGMLNGIDEFGIVDWLLRENRFDFSPETRRQTIAGLNKLSAVCAMAEKNYLIAAENAACLAEDTLVGYCEDYDAEAKCEISLKAGAGVPKFFAAENRANNGRWKLNAAPF